VKGTQHTFDKMTCLERSSPTATTCSCKVLFKAIVRIKIKCWSFNLCSTQYAPQTAVCAQERRLMRLKQRFSDCFKSWFQNAIYVIVQKYLI